MDNQLYEDYLAHNAFTNVIKTIKSKVTPNKKTYKEVTLTGGQTSGERLVRVTYYTKIKMLTVPGITVGGVEKTNVPAIEMRNLYNGRNGTMTFTSEEARNKNYAKLLNAIRSCPH